MRIVRDTNEMKLIAKSGIRECGFVATMVLCTKGTSR